MLNLGGGPQKQMYYKEASNDTYDGHSLVTIIYGIAYTKMTINVNTCQMNENMSVHTSETYNLQTIIALKQE